MDAANNLSKSFIREHILPVLFIFLIPGFSVWFFTFAENRFDGDIFEQIASEVRSNNEIPEAKKERVLSYYRENPPSQIMASTDPAAAESQAMFSPMAFRYAIFRWMKRIAWFCLLSIAATFVVVGISVAFSFRSQSAQYYALRIGWPMLRTAAAIQVIGQGILAVALSFWVTAIATESYFPKLILIIACLALIAIVALFRAIFAKIDDRKEIEGESISRSDAPHLWQRVDEMAERLSTAAPDRIIAGIAASFFVTEHPVILGGQKIEGRTLYLSLPMLKVMTVDEADAVLGHELGHFSGQDTLWSRKISPLLSEFALYMQVLANGFSLIVAQFMLLFWKLYNLSLGRLSRVREFRADQIGSELSSKDSMKRALVKVTCYCEYRAETEESIVSKQRVDPALNLSLQLEQGFPAFLSGFVQSDKAIKECVPHPFDTHPTLGNRLLHLGFEAHEALRDTEIPKVVLSSWYHAIGNAKELEEQMWAKQQTALQAFHSVHLAWTLLPKDEEEIAIVREHFPPVQFRNKDGVEATLDYDRLELNNLETPIYFKEISEVQLEDGWGKKRLSLTFRPKENVKLAKTTIYPELFISEKGNLLTAFADYYGRYKTACAAARK